MLVVADSSPLIVLTKISCIDLLPQLFGTVFIPPAISKELTASARPRVVQELILHQPSWLVERAPTIVEAIPTLDDGERAAISLAEELHADLLLMDETRGRRAAAARRLKVTGVIGILELTAVKKLIDLAEIFERIKRTDFWIPHEFLDERLKLFLAQRKAKGT